MFLPLPIACLTILPLATMGFAIVWKPISERVNNSRQNQSFIYLFVYLL